MNANPLGNKAQRIARAVKEQHGRALLVGGFVRDELLGLSPKDADLEVYGIEAPALRDLLKRFGKVDCVGESFRVYKLAWHEDRTRHELDVSLPRRDIKTGTGHRGFEVEGDPFASIEDAARRRDFTVNAILKDPLTDELLDPFNGRQDLANRVLRMVDASHFAEDSLRVLRAMQFAARFEMTIDPATVEVCRAIDLSDLPRERVWGEWEKLLLKARKPSLGLQAAEELGILDKLFPFLAQVRRSRFCMINPLPHTGGRTQWPAIDETIDRASLICRGFPRAAISFELSPPRQLTLMLAAFEMEASPQNFMQLTDALGVKTIEGYKVREQIMALNEARQKAAVYGRSRQIIPCGQMRRLVLHCEPQLLASLLLAQDGDISVFQWLTDRLRECGVENGPPTPLLMGRHLLEMGLNPGPQIGKITRAVYEMQLDGTVSTLDEAQEAARRLLTE